MKNKLLEKIQNDNSEMFDFFKKFSQDLYESIDLTSNIDVDFDFAQKIRNILKNNRFYNLFEDFYFVKCKEINYLGFVLTLKNKSIVSCTFNKKEFFIYRIIIPTNINNLSVLHSEDLSFIYNNDLLTGKPIDEDNEAVFNFLNNKINKDMIEAAQLTCDLDISCLVDFNMTPFLIKKEDGIYLLKNYTSEEKFIIRPRLPR